MDQADGRGGAYVDGVGIAVDADGNIYLTGGTEGGLDGNTLMGTADFFLAKYDALGNKVYVRQMGAAETFTWSAGIAVDADGNIYVTGFTQGGLDGNTLTGAADVFLAKYDATGSKVWVKQMGAVGAWVEGAGIAVDADGNIYVAGGTGGGLDDNTLMGTDDFFLAKYDATGSKVWVKQMGAAGAPTWGTGVATDADGNIYVTGFTEGGLDGNARMGPNDVFLAKYDAAGSKRWVKQMGAAGVWATSRGIATDPAGNVFLAGYTGGARLDGTPSTGASDLFVVKYDNEGNKVYTQQMGAAGAYVDGVGIAVDADGNIYLTGGTEGGLDGNTLMGTADFFLAKYDALGNKVYVRQMGATDESTRGNGIATDPAGNVFVTGYTEGALDGNPLTGVGDVFVVKYDNEGNKQ